MFNNESYNISKVRKDRLKSIILAILILSSVIQVGILWAYQTTGIPFSFFLSIFGESNPGNMANIEEKAREELFKPYRLVISNGDEAHWLVKENEEIYWKITEEVQKYIKRIISSKQVESGTISTEEWKNLLLKKGIFIEFRTGIKTSLARWFLNVKGDSSESPDSIYKIIMLPDEDINLNNIIYILGEKKIYKFVLPFQKNDMSREEYNKIIKRFEADSSRIKYSMGLEIDPEGNSPFDLAYDLLCVIEDVRNDIRYDMSPYLEFSFGPDILNIEEIAKILLGNEKESYDRYVDRNNTMVFKNISNTYRIYRNGFLEYRYTQDIGRQGRGDIAKAFEKAFILISRINDYLLDSQASLSLIDINEDNPDYYEFVFDYIIDGYPIYIDYSDENRSYKHAVTIKANGDRIIEADWLLMNFYKGMNYAQYSISFEDIIQSVFLKYSIGSYSEFSAKNMMVGYFIDNSYKKELPPVWIIEKQDAGYYNVSLLSEEDE